MLLFFPRGCTHNHLLSQSSDFVSCLLCVHGFVRELVFSNFARLRYRRTTVGIVPLWFYQLNKIYH